MAKSLPFRLILASGSLGRRELLKLHGYDFEVRPSHVDEPAGEGRLPQPQPDRRRRSRVERPRGLLEPGSQQPSREVVPHIGQPERDGSGLVQHQAGRTIRERNQIRRQVKALSAEGRLSAIVLLLLPIGVLGFLLLIRPGYFVSKCVITFVMKSTRIVARWSGGTGASQSAIRSFEINPGT